MTRNINEKMDYRRKPNLSHQIRDVPLNVVNEYLMEIVIDATSNEIKETLLKVKVDKSYDKNIKNLGGPEVDTLKDVVM